LRVTPPRASGIIINGMDAVQLRGRHWAHDLKSHTEAFAQEVSNLKRWDAEVIASRANLERLQAQLAGSFAEHCRLTRQLDILESHQNTIEQSLATLSTDLNRMETYA